MSGDVHVALHTVYAAMGGRCDVRIWRGVGYDGPEGWRLEIDDGGEMGAALCAAWNRARSVQEAVEALDAEIARRRQG